MGLVGIGVRLFRNGLQIGQATTDGSGNYLFAGLAAGQYTVRADQPAWLPISSTPNEVTLTITDASVTLNFGDWTGFRTYLPVMLR
jgi:hypothetical protein